MSDHSISTNSTGSSNSWTVLTPDANGAAVENLGPQEDRRGSLTDVSSLSEEASGAVAGGEVPGEGGRSEEGLQVCQESTPESDHGSAPPSPTCLTPSPSSHIPLLSDVRSYGPTVLEQETHTVSGLTPPSCYTDTYADAYAHVPVGSFPESSVLVTGEGVEQLQENEQSELAKKVSEVGKQAVRLVDQLVEDMFLIWGRRLTGLRVSDTHYDSELGESAQTQGDRLRRRKVHPLGPLDKADEEEEEEEEFRPIQRDQDGGPLSLNKCIVAALLLLGVGTLLFSEENVEHRELTNSEVPSLQEWLSSEAEALRSQEMAQLVDKLAHENQEITVLQAQLQAQTEELNLALRRAEEGGKELARKEELEKENERMRAELSNMPDLQRELETLRARVSELVQITAHKDSTPAPVLVLPPTGQTDNISVVGDTAGVMEEMTPTSDRLTEELERQRVLLEESRKRLEGMKAEGRGEQVVREGLAQMERRLTEQVEKLGRRRRAAKKDGRPQGEGEMGRRGEKERWGPDAKEWQKEGRQEWRGEKEWQSGRDEKDWRKGRNGEKYNRNSWKKEEGKEWGERKDWKAGNEGENGKPLKPREEKRKDWPKDGERKRDGWKGELKNGDWKPHKEHRGEGEQASRHGDVGGRKNRHWQGAADKTPLEPSHRHHEHNDYWKQKKQKLRHYYRPLEGCDDVASCAKAEGLDPVQWADFQALLDGYLEKLGEGESAGQEEISTLVRDFFPDGVFSHDRMSFRDFVEDVAEILEDMAEGQGSDEMEEEMEKFEKEALRKFTSGDIEDGGELKRVNVRVRG
ncbi:pre-B-cell leukemia transcription factor-interacting protein 1-like isoform X2 [Brienomyrus brachyistius]|uniref:pre-B-cell leukemia transcription factor-interacting protein 1-like isoform X2 n=1 Tax=Brienomyrus brachyistius TaxID=42636 RepID=UPI0020B3A02C|nr:pre-B-cell leukemia transcription factor-interacting protein 1-like isoform X2 [Brienomyrus brachyistius]